MKHETLHGMIYLQHIKVVSSHRIDTTLVRLFLLATHIYTQEYSMPCLHGTVIGLAPQIEVLLDRGIFHSQYLTG